MGPTTLFVKSFLQMLNLDESAVFDCLYSANICPIFYTEVTLCRASAGRLIGGEGSAHQLNYRERPLPVLTLCVGPE